MRRRDFVMAMPFALHVLTSSAQPATINVASLGAIGDGKTLNTAILQRALDQAAATSGGATVLIPAGTFLTGSLTLGSNTTLHLAAGATLKGSPSLADYSATQGHSGPGKHLLSARDAHNIRLTGSGTLDGNADAFLRRRDPPVIFEPGKEWLDVVIFDWRPIEELQSMVEFTNCKDLHISGITLAHSPRWTLLLHTCNTVTITDFKIRNSNHVPESDGIDITCCQNVTLTRCDIETADDAICLKSEGPIPCAPTRDITITDCRMTGCCNGFKIGTGSFGAFENIRFTRSVIYNATTQPPRERMIGALCVEVVDGGSLKNVQISDIQIQNARTPLFVRLGHRRNNPGTLQDVLFENITATGAISASSITGIPGAAPHGITLRNVKLHTTESGQQAWAHAPVPELEDHYPEALMFEHLPAYGLYIRHASGIHLDRVALLADKPDQRPALLSDDVSDLTLNHLITSAPHSPEPVLALHDTRGAQLQNLTAPAGTGTFLRVTGASSDIRLAHNNLSAAKEPFHADDPSQVILP